jgi:hypothetical protein
MAAVATRQFVIMIHVDHLVSVDCYSSDPMIHGVPSAAIIA